MTPDTYHGRTIAEWHAYAAALSVELEQCKAELRHAQLKCRNSLANNLCPDHRDKQGGKPCLACEVERLQKGATT